MTRGALRAALLAGTAFVGVWPTLALAVDLDLAGNNLTLPQAGSFGNQPYLNGADGVTNNGGANATLTEGGGPAGTTYSGLIQDGASTTAIVHTGGEVTFTGANTYSGGTTISGGTIVVGHQTGGTINSLGTGTVTLDGGTLSTTVSGLLPNSITFNDNKTSTFSAGSQTVTLDNSVLVTINPGAVAQFGTAGDTGTIIYGAGSNVVDLTSSVVVAGGTLQDSGNSLVGLTYYASTAVNAGAVLDFNNSSNQAIRNLTGGGSVVTGTIGGTTLSLYVDQNTASTFSGVISGPGTVLFQTYSGTGGTMVLTGANTYTGGTIICLCTTLQLGDGGTTGSIVGDVQNGGTLIFNRSDRYVFTGNISDDGGNSGALVQNGTGTTVLTGSNSYTGGTRIRAGVLEAGHADGSNVIDALGDPSGPEKGLVRIRGGTLRINIGPSISSQLNNDVTFGSDSTGTLTVASGQTVTLASDRIKLDSNTIAQFGSTTDTGTIIFKPTKANTVPTAAVVVAGGTLQAGNKELGHILGDIDGLTSKMTTSTTVNAGATLDFDDNFASIHNLRGAGTVNIGKKTNSILRLWVDPDQSVEFSGNITGKGSVQVGTSDFGINGTTILSGTNTYTGGTDICSCSILQLGAGGTTGSIVGDVRDGGTLAFNRSDTYVFAGNISDFGPEAGQVMQIGTGTTVLTGNNTYSNGTFFKAGTLSVGAETNLGDPSGALTFNGGILQITGTTFTSTARTINWNAGGGGFDIASAANTFTVSQPLGGAGGLAKLGPGVLVLSGANTYSGATNVNAGTLRAGVANTFSPNSAFNIAAGATLDLNSFSQTLGSFGGAGAVSLGSANLTAGGNNSSTTFSGVMSGAGSFTKTGTGTLTLTNANTYSGGTTLAKGTLRLENSQALGTGPLTTTGSVVDYGSGITIANPIIVNSNTTQLQVTTGSATQSGAISELNGPRPLEKIGAGALLLTAVNTYTGPTTVSAGILEVDGSIANSAVTVAAGASLTGFGTVGGVSVKSGGTFAPGVAAAPGTMTVRGNLAFESGALYVVQVNSMTASLARVAGTATLAGNVLAVFAPGNLLRQYPIVTAGSRSGTFDALATSGLPAAFNASLSYTSTDALLNLTATLGSNGGLNRNQQNVANSLNSFFNNGGPLPPAFVNVFGLTGTSLGNALSQLSGEAATGIRQAGFQSMDLFLNAMLDPFVEGRGAAGSFGAMSYAPAQRASSAFAMVDKAPSRTTAIDQRWGAWGSAYGGYNSLDGNSVLGSHDSTTRTGGFAGGADYRVSRDTVLGAAVAMGETHWGLSDGLGGGRSELAQVGLYGSTRWNAAYFSAALAAGWHRASTSRTVSLGLVEPLAGDFDASVIGARVESGYRFDMAAFGLTPYAAVQAQSINTSAFAERGGSTVFALNYGSQTGTDARSELGAWLDTRHELDAGAQLLLRGRAAWSHEFADGRDVMAAFQSLPGASVLVNGATAARNAALTSAAAELRLPDGLTFVAKVDGQFADGSQTLSGTATLRKAW